MLLEDSKLHVTNGVTFSANAEDLEVTMQQTQNNGETNGSNTSRPDDYAAFFQWVYLHLLLDELHDEAIAQLSGGLKDLQNDLLSGLTGTKRQNA